MARQGEHREREADSVATEKVTGKLVHPRAGHVCFTRRGSPSQKRKSGNRGFLRICRREWNFGTGNCLRDELARGRAGRSEESDRVGLNLHKRGCKSSSHGAQIARPHLAEVHAQHQIAKSESKNGGVDSTRMYAAVE